MIRRFFAFLLAFSLLLPAAALGASVRGEDGRETDVPSGVSSLMDIVCTAAMLKDQIESIRKEIDDIERRQRELKLLRAQKISELDRALYRQAVEGMPFPSGTKVTVIYKNLNGIQERTVCYLGNPKPTRNSQPPTNEFVGLSRALAPGDKSPG